jgi:multidrug efflux system membrane fusion protein
MNRPRLIVILSGLMATAPLSGCQNASSSAAKPPPIITYDHPITRVITDYEEFPGDTRAFYDINVRARVAGYMTDVLFHDGDMVKEGQVLFQIDNRQYKAELDRAIGNVHQIEAHLWRVEREYQRAKGLLARGSISPEECDRYETDFKETGANLKLAKGNRDLAQLNYDWCDVRAGISGLASRRLVDPGNLVKTDDTILTSIVKLDPIYVYFVVQEESLLRIRRLMEQGKIKAKSLREVPVKISLSDEAQESFSHEGMVDFTDNHGNPASGTLQFRAQLPNPDGFIFPGLYVRVRLPIGDPHPAIMIRDRARVADQGINRVWVVKAATDKNGKPLSRKVGQVDKPLYEPKPIDVGELGVLVDGYRVIKKGIGLKDMVVISGMQRLHEGERVTVEPYRDETKPAPVTVAAKAKAPDAAAKLKPRYPIVTYDLPITKTITDFEPMPGETRAIYTVDVRARVAGYMTKVCFKDGDLMKAGQTLFQIDSREYKAELDRASGNVQQLEAHLWRVEREYQRATGLLARNSISQEECDRYEADWKESAANLQLAKANRDLAQLNYDWCDVKAPISGLCSRRMVDPGNLVKADDTILTSVVSLDQIYVYFDVHEQTMLKIRRLLDQGKIKARSLEEAVKYSRSMRVKVSLSDEDKANFAHEGQVDFTDNRVDPNRGTLQFRASLSNPNNFIAPGLFAQVRLPIGDAHSAIMVREEARENGQVNNQGINRVWVLKPTSEKNGEQQLYMPYPVDVGALGVLEGGYREIERGIKPDDKVVVSGMQRLREGQLVLGEPYRPEPTESPPGPVPASAKQESHAGPGSPASATAATPVESQAPPATDGRSSALLAADAPRAAAPAPSGPPPRPQTVPVSRPPGTQ